MDGVPGGPAGSLQWLAEHLADHGLPLRPGQLVLTGTPLGLIRVRPGDHVRVTAEHLGAVEATIGPEPFAKCPCAAARRRTRG